MGDSGYHNSWLKDKISTLIWEMGWTENMRSMVSNIDKMKEMKKELYLMADEMLAEGQTISKDKLDAWWLEKRAQLKMWAGE